MDREHHKHIDYAPVIVPVVVLTVPTITLSLLSSSKSWYQMVYLMSVLPPKDSGGSQLRVMVVLVVDVILKFLGSDGGSEISNS